GAPREALTEAGARSTSVVTVPSHPAAPRRRAGVHGAGLAVHVPQFAAGRRRELLGSSCAGLDAAVREFPRRIRVEAVVRAPLVRPLSLGTVVALDVGQQVGITVEVLLLLGADRTPMGAVETRAAVSDAAGEPREVEVRRGGRSRTCERECRS